MSEKQPKKAETERCANCGDPYKVTQNILGERESKGWCVGCYTQWKKHCHVRRDGTQSWSEPGESLKHRPNGYTSRPEYDAP